MKNNDYMDKLKEMAEPTEEELAKEAEAAAKEEAEREAPYDTTDSILCKIKMRVKDMRHFLFKHNYSSISGWFGVVISVAALVMVYMGRDKYSEIETGILLFLGLLFTVIRPVQILFQARRQVKKQKMFQKPIDYYLCKEGIVIKQDEEYANVPWEGVMRLRITGKAVMIYTSPLLAFILPKDQMEDADAVVNLIREKTGK